MIRRYSRKKLYGKRKWFRYREPLVFPMYSVVGDTATYSGQRHLRSHYRWRNGYKNSKSGFFD